MGNPVTYDLGLAQPATARDAAGRRLYPRGGRGHPLFSAAAHREHWRFRNYRAWRYGRSGHL